MTRLAFALLVVLSGAPVSAAMPTGWRNDGSGIYPNCDPPVQWGRVSKSVAALRAQADPPKGDEPSGQPMADGLPRQWLLLGPVAAEKLPKGALGDPVLAEDQSALAPAAGQELAGARWAAINTDTAYIDCARQFDAYGTSPDRVAYAHTYIYSPADADFIVRIMHTASAHLWVNGKPTHKFAETELNYTPQPVKLRKGWNGILVRITPFRGGPNDRPISGTWYASLAFQAAPQTAQYDQQNIVWKTALPSVQSFGPPIVVAGRVYLLSDPADLVCIDAATGKTLWVRSNNYHELASDEDKAAQPDLFKQIQPLAARLQAVNDSFAGPNPPAPQDIQGRDGFKEKLDLEGQLYALMRKVDKEKYALPNGQDVGYSGMTPVSDGQRIYAWFATGVTCCYDLDGKLLWRRLDNEGSFFEHGYSSSPVLADGKLIVFMNKMIAFDAATGNRLWTTEFQQPAAKRFHGTPAVATIGQTPVCILPSSHVLRLSDGKIIRQKGPEFVGLQQEIPSPLVLGNSAYMLSTYGRFFKITLPAEVSDPLNHKGVRKLEFDLNRYPTNYLPWHLASPLVHDGLAYLINNTGVLTVVDVQTLQVVYEKLLDLDHFQTAHEGPGRGIGASPALAGGRIYLVGPSGSTLVIKPGRTYEQLAKNKIESVIHRYWGLRHERFVSAPAFDANRLFLRGERHLYCISPPNP